MTHTTRALFLGLTAVFTISRLLPVPGADGRIDHLPSVCPFHQLTGLPCPGCGLTRAFVCLSHGQFVQSLHWHPIGWLVYGVFLVLWARAGLTWALGHPFAPLSAKTSGWLNWAGLATLLLVGAVRIGWTLVHPSLGIP
jgi:hypothetical protein